MGDLEKKNKHPKKSWLPGALWFVVAAVVLVLSAVGMQTFNDFISPDAGGIAKFRDMIDD